jgi:hypothetical protein
VQASDPQLPIKPGTAVFGVNLDTLPQSQKDAVEAKCRTLINSFTQLASPAQPWGTTDVSKRAFAQCMRTHGYPDFPDANPGANDFPLGKAGINSKTAEFKTAAQACAVGS